MKANRTRVYTIISILAVVAIILAYIGITLVPEIPSYKNQTDMTLRESVEIENTLSTTPITRPVYGKGFYYITPNYTSFYNEKGELQWNEIFSLNNVEVSQSGEYIATAQYNVNSTTIYVFNPDGLVYNVKPNKKVLKHSVNPNGYLALIFEEGSGYQIQTFDNTGNRILTYTFAEKNSIPVDVSISDNNKYLAIPFFNYDGIVPVSKTVFLYLDKNDTNANTTSNDAIFAGFDLDNTIPFMSRFIGNDLILVTDKKVVRYDVANGSVTEAFQIDVLNYISDVSLINDKYILIAFSEKMTNDSPIEANQIVIYDVDGNQLGATEPIPNLQFVTGAYDGFIAESNNNITYYNFKCKPIYSFSLEETINDAYVINKDLDTVITTSKTRIYEVVRTRKDF